MTEVVSVLRTSVVSNKQEKEILTSGRHILMALLC